MFWFLLIITVLMFFVMVTERDKDINRTYGFVFVSSLVLIVINNYLAG